MKKRLILSAFTSLLLSVALAECQQLTIQTENGKQTVLTRSDIESLPHIKVTTHGADTAAATFEGVARDSMSDPRQHGLLPIFRLNGELLTLRQRDAQQQAN